MCQECARSEQEQFKKLVDSDQYKKASPIDQTGAKLAFRLRKILHLDDPKDKKPNESL
jgi:hypothetical protein